LKELDMVRIIMDIKSLKEEVMILNPNASHLRKKITEIDIDASSEDEDIPPKDQFKRFMKGYLFGRKMKKVDTENAEETSRTGGNGSRAQKSVQLPFRTPAGNSFDSQVPVLIGRDLEQKGNQLLKM
jgi:hypothetical protein